MKHKSVKMGEKTSIKYKIFLYLLSFVMILLAVLWVFQICYLDTFYKLIKNREAEKALEQAISILQDDEIDVGAEIDSLAAECNLSILVTDTRGTTIYSAEYIMNSKMSTIPYEEFEQYYRQAKEQGGRAKIEFKGNKNVTMPRMEEEPPAGMDMGKGPPAGNEDFFQNHGQKMVQSAIYIQIINSGTEDMVVMVNSQLTPVDATVDTLRVQFIWIFAILILLSLIIAFLLSQKISHPIILVNHSAKELAKGNYSIEFAGKDYREIAELSETLNYAARELEKTETLRKELIANVSHDLRTPLTMIIAYAEVMRDLPGENTPENIQVVIDESSRLTNLVNDMLDISKLQAGVMERNSSVYNLTESIKSVLERYNKLKEQDGYIIDFQYQKDVMVKADEFKMYQVIYNLVNNAINYTGTDKKVEVRQMIKNHTVRIEVADTGEGIAAEALPYVWDRYYKVDKTHRRAVMGTGLGLSIVKNILILHESAYGVESQQGKGSTFWFELPEYEKKEPLYQ